MDIAERLALVLADDHHHVLLVRALEEYRDLLAGYSEDVSSEDEREQWIKEAARIDRIISILDSRN